MAYSPEREDPGNKNFSTSIIPKIVGADDSKTTKLVYELYKQVISKVVEVSSTQVAEAAKLTENIFRSVNIALVNELRLSMTRWVLMYGKLSKRPQQNIWVHAFLSWSWIRRPLYTN